MKRFNDLQVWQKAVDFAVQVYEETRDFPKEEIYGLTSQLRRAAVSIPSNIAEGHSRNPTGDFLRFLSMAQGSCSEIETLLFIARQLNYLSQANYDQHLDRLAENGRMLSGLEASLKRCTESSSSLPSP